MTNTPLVSIIIVTYNCAEVIHQCINSCLKEKNSEIIVVDNASTDETLTLCEQFTNQIILIKNKSNRGFTQASNQGIKAAKGKYILLLNPDAWLTEGTLNALTTYLSSNTTIGAVAPILKYPDGTLQKYTRTFPTVTGLWVESFIPMRWWHKFKAYRKYTCQDLDFSITQQVEQPAGAALLFRNQWLLDENYFIYGSDVDLCKTIVNDGFQIIQTPEAVVYHHQSKGGTENQGLRLYLDLDNYFGMRYYFRKHNQPFNHLSYFTLFSLSLLLRTLFSIVSLNKDSRYRWEKFLGFIQGKNFKALYE